MTELRFKIGSRFAAPEVHDGLGVFAAQELQQRQGDHEVAHLAASKNSDVRCLSKLFTGVSLHNQSSAEHELYRKPHCWLQEEGSRMTAAKVVAACSFAMQLLQ